MSQVILVGKAHDWYIVIGWHCMNGHVIATVIESFISCNGLESMVAKLFGVVQLKLAKPV